MKRDRLHGTVVYKPQDHEDFKWVNRQDTLINNRDGTFREMNTREKNYQDRINRERQSRGV